MEAQGKVYLMDPVAGYYVRRESTWKRFVDWAVTGKKPSAKRGEPATHYYGSLYPHIPEEKIPEIERMLDEGTIIRLTAPSLTISPIPFAATVKRDPMGGTIMFHQLDDWDDSTIETFEKEQLELFREGKCVCKFCKDTDNE